MPSRRKPPLLEKPREVTDAAADDLAKFFAEAELMDLLENYLYEMDLFGGLEVCLVPAPDPQHSTHSIRVAMSQNPPWYRRFADQYKNCRGIGRKQMIRPRTFIRRDKTEKAIRRILAGDRSGIYAERILEFAKRELSNRRQAERAAREPVDPNAEPMPF